jgi:hypothetical protein
MKLLSYSFFEPKQLPGHRFWDKDRADAYRYYFNIPAVVLTNSILFPDYTTKIYLTSNVLANELSLIFKILQDSSLPVEIVIVDMDYSLTEPSLLRMAPLWDDVEVFHTRDMDSIPTKVEFDFVCAFEASDCSVGSIRSHENHYGTCGMLAGLSSFKPNKVPSRIKGGSFAEYFDLSHGHYGCDQDLMVNMFTSDPSFTKDGYMDCRAYRQNRLLGFPCSAIRSEDLDHRPSPLQAEILNKVLESRFENWSGEPVDARGDYTNSMLDRFPEVKSSIAADQTLREFYKV